jgi:CheY-like chemotaxis protein
MPLALLLNFNADERDMYREALENAGFGVVISTSPQQALMLALSLRPVAIVTRVLHPGSPMDGVEVTRRLKTDPLTASIRVIATMSLPELRYEQQMRDAGADECLSLPVFVQHVVEAVARAAASAQSAHPQHDVA